MNFLRVAVPFSTSACPSTSVCVGSVTPSRVTLALESWRTGAGTGGVAPGPASGKARSSEESISMMSPGKCLPTHSGRPSNHPALLCAATFPALRLGSSAIPSNEMPHDGDDREDEEEVNQSSSHMEHGEPKEPGKNEDNRQGNKHDAPQSK